MNVVVETLGEYFIGHNIVIETVYRTHRGKCLAVTEKFVILEREGGWREAILTNSIINICGIGE